MKSFAIQCLNKKDSERPSALELSERLSELKQTSLYTEKAQNRSDTQQCEIQLQEQLQQQQKQMASEREGLQHAKDRALDTKQRELEQTERQLQASEQLVSEFQQSLQQRDRTITNLQRILQQEDSLVTELQEILQQKTKAIFDLQQTIRTHERKFQQLEQQDAASGDQPGEESVTIPQPTVAAAEEEDGGKMRWKKGRDAPQVMWRGAAAVHGNTAYFTLWNSHKVYSYQNVSGHEQWSELPESPYINYGLAVIDGLLTSVGGVKDVDSSNILLSLREEGESKEWSLMFPPMPTPRGCVACITTEKALVVAGGEAGFFSMLSSIVEVMTLDTKQWSAASPLPRRCSLASAAVCGDSLYLLGGDQSILLTKSVYTCSLPDLISSNSESHNVWKEIRNLSVTGSTLASFGGDLLAIGGFDDSATTTSNVFKYDSSTDTWIVTSQIQEKRYHCLAVTLPGEILVVVGGGILKMFMRHKATKSVELLM